MQITVSNLSFAYPRHRDRWIFSDASVTFAAGRISAIVGTSGSGKSTLLKLLAGLIGRATYSGHITYGPDALCSDEMARAGRLTLCLQKPACLPWATVLQNVTIGLKLQNKYGNVDAADKLLKQFGLDDRRMSFPYSLSMGMQARVALSRAFVSDPAVVLLDEPFSSLDIGWKEQLYKYLLAAASTTGCTTLLVTHDIPEAICLADDVFVISAHSRTLTCCIAVNPLKQRADTLSIAAVVTDAQFSGLFGTIHALLATT